MLRPLPIANRQKIIKTVYINFLCATKLKKTSTKLFFEPLKTLRRSGFRGLFLGGKGLDNGRLVKKVHNFFERLSKSGLFASEN